MMPLRMDRRDTIFLGFAALANTTDQLEYILPADCELKTMRIRFYVDNLLRVRVYPLIQRRGQGAGVADSLINYFSAGAGGTAVQNYISGDDDDFPFVLNKPAFELDRVIIRYTNIDLVDTFDVRVLLDVEYINLRGVEGGRGRG